MVCYGLLVAALGVLTAGLLGLAPTAVVASPDKRMATAEVVVRPGETLWTVAVRHEPHRNPAVTIEEIRRLNGLQGYTVHPGQTLRLP
ncbi:MAG: LysM peptidoglycan-binding domain-containing protein [Micromonosporaceae bacterium]